MKYVLWVFRCVRMLAHGVVLVVGVAFCATVVYVVWKALLFTQKQIGFRPLNMVLAQYTPTDVVGDLGGMKVRIPRTCAEYVEYDGDPGWGERRNGPVPARTFDSRLKSFGIDARYPEMTCKGEKGMQEDYSKQALKHDKPWISIGINAGEIYPGLGDKAADGLARGITDTIAHPDSYWMFNYERLPRLHHGLEAYVVTGVDPQTGELARKNMYARDIFLHRAPSGIVDTYINCDKALAPGGVAGCDMTFGMEHKAKVSISARFARPHLPRWRAMRRATIDLLTAYEVRDVRTTAADP